MGGIVPSSASAADASRNSQSVTRVRRALTPLTRPAMVTVCYITDGIKKLRAVGASLPDANTQRDFWRGMRNIELPEGFRQTGGTEFAPLSTSSELKVRAAQHALG
eukprot:scaffold27196_cov111-Isochrysis_galbana.AAC.3